jgi:hypothetical protein
MSELFGGGFFSIMEGKIKPMSQIKQVLWLHSQGVGKKTIARNSR